MIDCLFFIDMNNEPRREPRSNQFEFLFEQENQQDVSNKITAYFNGEETGKLHENTINRLVKVFYSKIEKTKTLQVSTMLHKNMVFNPGYRECVPHDLLHNPILTILFSTDHDSNIGEQADAFEHDFLCIQCEVLITNEGLIHGLRHLEDPIYDIEHLRLAGGFHIPDTFSVTIKTSYIPEDSNDYVEFVRALYPDDPHMKSNFLIFGGPPLLRNSYSKNENYHQIMTQILTRIEIQFRDLRYCIWGGELPILYSPIKTGTETPEKEVNLRGIFGVNIHGLDIESHTLLLQSCSDTTPITERVEEFREGIILKAYSIGFVNSIIPRDKKDYYTDCVNELRSYFPNTKFTFLLGYKDEREGECKRRVIIKDHGNLASADIAVENCLMSILIMTFDETRSLENSEASSTACQSELGNQFDSKAVFDKVFANSSSFHLVEI